MIGIDTLELLEIQKIILINMSTVHDIPGGTLEVLQDGTKIQKTNGVSLVVKPDGTKIQVHAVVYKLK